mmetsp:Transcript_91075/g.253572  ORF Transcript_91075/g.253572 Transcript_91075/m.253572 type:complete len:301 (+) Transcript_91075:200-1102(+)|eukprot:CAMPEP_0179109910 /NCGR_PEP_ID=MMETSP0796-20121207/51270_1 /TAXON_ID=73915 /ORGANISM="Pyrodinium bahamense, Strain pbaha01" /LENGTH=300 /DNA_ID=CAMNT_0020808029 /DNA_START=110 /DNA_END=1012 /DNA_ORIENTATION=-
MSVRGEKRHLRSGSGVPPEHTSGGARFKTAVGHCVTSVLMVAEASGTLGCIMRWSWISVLFCLMAAATVGALLCARDLHVRFWLGEVPELSLASLAVAVGLTLFIVCYRVWVLSYRGHPRLGARKATSDAPCLLSLRTLRTICFLLAFAACSAFGLGVVTIRFGQDMSNVLITRCGHSGATRSMEQVHQELVVFRNQCHKGRADRAKTVDQCPGYADAFPPPAPYATYLKLLEMQSGCTGFCKRGIGPLFTNSVALKHQSCAAHLGEYVWHVSLMVAWPALALGAFFVAFGTALLLYEDL